MFRFPILGSSRKKKILVKPLVRKVHNICNGRLLITTNIIEFQKSLPKSTTPTPHMMPKFNSVTNTNLELNGFWKGWPALSYGSPKTNTIWIGDFFCTPTSPIIPIFSLNNLPLEMGCLSSLSPQSFPQHSLIERWVSLLVLGLYLSGLVFGVSHIVFPCLISLFLLDFAFDVIVFFSLLWIYNRKHIALFYQ